MSESFYCFAEHPETYDDFIRETGLYIADATPRKVTGHGRGEGECNPSHSLKFMFTSTDFY